MPYALCLQLSELDYSLIEVETREFKRSFTLFFVFFFGGGELETVQTKVNYKKLTPQKL